MQILNDFHASVEKALEEIDRNYLKYRGTVVCGTHTPHDVDELISEIRKAREASTPFLGICFGHQLAAIEYARNVVGWKSATSEEFSEKGDFIVRKMEKMRVGMHTVYENDTPRLESFWHQYEVHPDFYDLWKKNDNFITVQYHPEYQSSKNSPHPILVKFLNHAKMAM